MAVVRISTLCSMTMLRSYEFGSACACGLPRALRTPWRVLEARGQRSRRRARQSAARTEGNGCACPHRRAERSGRCGLPRSARTVLPSPFVSPHHNTAITPILIAAAVSYPLKNFLDLLNGGEQSPGSLSQDQGLFVSLYQPGVRQGPFPGRPQSGKFDKTKPRVSRERKATGL